MEGLKKYQKENQVELSGPERAMFLANFQDKRVLQTALETSLAWHTDDFPEMDVTLTLENGERLLAGARSQYAFMLPWVITRNGKFAQTWNPDIARALAGLLPRRFTNFSRLSGAEIRFNVIWFINKYNQRALKVPRGR